MSGDTALRLYVYALTAGLLAWAGGVAGYLLIAGARLGRRVRHRLRPQKPTT